MSAAGVDWPASFGGIPVTDLGTIIARNQKVRLDAGTSLVARTDTPLLDRLAVNRGIGSGSPRRSSYAFDFAGGVIAFETSRLGGGSPNRLMKAELATARKSWSVGLRSGWALDANDNLSVGVAGGADHGPPRGLVVTYPHDVTSSTMVGLNWAHGQRWQMDLGWREVGGTARGAQDRMVQLSDGAPLHQAGIEISAAFLPGGQADRRRTSIGVEARRSTIAADDFDQVNANQRQITQGALVLKTHF